jgi:hypothetical protein
MRQPDNLPAFCRVHRNGRPLIGMCGKPAAKPADTGNAYGTRGVRRESGPCGAGAAQLANVAAVPGGYRRSVARVLRAWP